jgi:hypothetical protein
VLTNKYEAIVAKSAQPLTSIVNSLNSFRSAASRVQYALREIERRLHQPRSEHIEILSPLIVEHVLPI